MSALGTPHEILDKMNATSPAELFLISPRWLAEQELLTAVSYRPGFIDEAQVQCGPGPFEAAMKDQASRADEKYDRWVSQFGVLSPNRRNLSSSSKSVATPSRSQPKCSPSQSDCACREMRNAQENAGAAKPLAKFA